MKKGCIAFLIFIAQISTVAATNPIVEFQTSKGNFIVKLYPELAPLTVANFLSYVKDGYYDNTLIHRVIDGVLIQGGGFEKGYKAKKMKAPIKNESEGGLKNTRGRKGLALSTDSKSGASQFYINVANNPHLDYNPRRRKPGFAVFGDVIEGMKVVDSIKKVRTYRIEVYSEFYKQDVPLKDVPQKDILIKKVSILR
jgi:cyclophilin family peptidyl-prolyl cis-trans isomerase